MNKVIFLELNRRIGYDSPPTCSFVLTEKLEFAVCKQWKIGKSLEGGYKKIYICVYIIERRADFRTVATLARSWHLVISIWLLGLDLYAACSNIWTSWIEGQARVIVNNCNWCSCCHVWCQMQFVQQGSLVPSPSQILSHSRVPDFISQPWLWDKICMGGAGDEATAGACEVQNQRLCGDQRRLQLPLFFDQVPETRDEQHKLGQKQLTFWVESPTG